MASTLLKESLVVGEALHECGKLVVVFDFETAATGFQSLSLLEFLVVGAEDDGHVPYSCLQRVVNAHTETAADVSNITIIIDAAQQSEAVNDERIGLGCLLAGGLSKANDPTTPDPLSNFPRGGRGLLGNGEFSDNLMQMVFANDMRGNDEFPFRMLIEVLDKDVFIGRPGRTGNEDVAGCWVLVDTLFPPRMPRLSEVAWPTT